MDVGTMRVGVLVGLVDVRVHVWLRRGNAAGVRVFVFDVVHVLVLMLDWCVLVEVLVAFRYRQPDAGQHERGGGEHATGQRFAEHNDGYHYTHERRDRKVGTGARRPDRTQRVDEQHEAQPVANDPNADRTDHRSGIR